MTFRATYSWKTSRHEFKSEFNAIITSCPLNYHYLVILGQYAVSFTAYDLQQSIAFNSWQKQIEMAPERAVESRKCIYKCMLFFLVSFSLWLNFHREITIAVTKYISLSKVLLLCRPTTWFTVCSITDWLTDWAAAFSFRHSQFENRATKTRIKQFKTVFELRREIIT